ncbi:MAG TPA: hypothetical protein VK978_01890 [Candidatus Saccharimonadales bacterium]|nr:hypothetical protein [Candidatus Saccharimonadales bacterium]
MTFPGLMIGTFMEADDKQTVGTEWGFWRTADAGTDKTARGGRDNL